MRSGAQRGEREREQTQTSSSPEEDSNRKAPTSSQTSSSQKNALSLQPELPVASPLSSDVSSKQLEEFI